LFCEKAEAFAVSIRSLPEDERRRGMVSASAQADGNPGLGCNQPVCQHKTNIGRGGKKRRGRNAMENKNKNKNNEEENIVDAAIKIGACGIGYFWGAMMLEAGEIVPNKETEMEDINDHP
jgi:hypothetical protein